MPFDLRGKKLVGLLPVNDALHGEKCGKSFLPKAELPLDLAFRLRVFGNQMADPEAAEGALKLREGIGVAGLAGLMSEEA